MDLVPGATAVVVLVPAADPLVADVRRAHAAGSLAVPAHVTLMYPFLELTDVDAGVCAELAAICAGEPAFDVLLRRCGRFPGVLWLDPEPAGPFRRLTGGVTGRWPRVRPYGGQWPDPVPHLTVVEHDQPGVLASAELDVTARLPVRARVTQAELMAYDGDQFTCHARLPLG